MSKWNYVFVNDPDDNFNIVIDIEFDNKYCATIKKVDEELVLCWYSSPKDHLIPVNWLHKILDEAQQKL